LKRGQIDKTILNALGYVLDAQNLTDTPEGHRLMNLTGSELQNKAEEILSDFFEVSYPVFCQRKTVEVYVG